MSIPLTEIMDENSITVFETTTMKFLNDYLPKYNGTKNAKKVEITEVTVMDQSLRQARRNMRSLQQANQLTVEIITQAVVYPEEAGKDVDLNGLLATVFDENKQAYEDALKQASSFFRDGGTKPDSLLATNKQTEVDNGQKGPPIVIILVATACFTTLAIGGLIYRKFRMASQKEPELPDSSLHLMSWSTNSPRSVEEGKRYNEALATSEHSSLCIPAQTEDSVEEDEDEEEDEGIIPKIVTHAVCFDC